VASLTTRPLYLRERDAVSIVQETGWAPGPVWTPAENLASTGIRSPDRPTRSESLYRLSYRGPQDPDVTNVNIQLNILGLPTNRVICSYFIEYSYSESLKVCKANIALHAVCAPAMLLLLVAGNQLFSNHKLSCKVSRIW
jgi:hypothetical protein